MKKQTAADTSQMIQDAVQRQERVALEAKVKAYSEMIEKAQRDLRDYWRK